MFRQLSFFLALLVSFNLIAQESSLCPLLRTQIGIENSDNVPEKNANPDGTITLTHQDENITALFADFTIHDFYPSFPTADPNGELVKYYTIAYENRNLITRLHNEVPSSVFESPDLSTQPIDNNLIDFVDGKTFRLSKEKHVTDVLTTLADFEDVPEGFILDITFTYDIDNEILNLEPKTTTPCGNTFNIGLKGEGENAFTDRLQTWRSTPLEPSTNSSGSNCDIELERSLYSLFEIACANINNGPIVYAINTIDNTITFTRSNLFFGSNSFIFNANILSTNANISRLEEMSLILAPSTRYLNFTNTHNKTLDIEVYSILGEKILAKTPYVNNSIHLNLFSKSMYLIRLSDAKGHYKDFKIIN